MKTTKATGHPSRLSEPFNLRIAFLRTPRHSIPVRTAKASRLIIDDRQGREKPALVLERLIVPLTPGCHC